MNDPIQNTKQLPPLLGMTLTQMDSLTQRAGFPAYRAKQLFQWIYQKGIASLDEATNLPKDYRAYLAENYSLGLPEIAHITGVAADTRKLALRLNDGKIIESVLMHDEERDRFTLCVSTQVGCPLACKFCMTGLGGFQRNLTVAEILGQVILAQRQLTSDQRLSNLVFMGMGEPMLNLEAVIPALQLLISPNAIGFSSRRITVSTAGVVPGIRKFGRRNPGASLAVSLNATTNETRSRIMPINRKYPIEELLCALLEFPMPQRRRITFEYVLLRGVNDSDADARRLIHLVHGIPCKINLICFNATDPLPFEPVDDVRLEVFRDILRHADLTVAVRYSKGRDLQAGCGQLAAHIQQKQIAS